MPAQAAGGHWSYDPAGWTGSWFDLALVRAADIYGNETAVPLALMGYAVYLPMVRR